MPEPAKMPVPMTVDEWRAEALRLFGPDEMKWRFKCPACGHEASVQDWKDAGASSKQVAFSCVGRHMEDPRDAFSRGPGPCNYAGGGLFGLNPMKVDGQSLFAFGAPADGS